MFSTSAVLRHVLRLFVLVCTFLASSNLNAIGDFADMEMAKPVRQISRSILISSDLTAS
jgi:hypothetical protein